MSRNERLARLRDYRQAQDAQKKREERGRPSKKDDSSSFVPQSSAMIVNHSCMPLAPEVAGQPHFDMAFKIR